MGFHYITLAGPEVTVQTLGSLSIPVYFLVRTYWVFLLLYLTLKSKEDSSTVSSVLSYLSLVSFAFISELVGSLVAQGPGSLCRAVFSKCCFGVLTNSSRASYWDVSGLPLLSSSHVTLGEWVERAQQLQDISSLLWTNMAVPSVAEFRYFSPWSSLMLLPAFHRV